MNRTRTTAAAIAAGVALLGLAACGGGDKPTAAPSPTPPAWASVSPADEAQNELTSLYNNLPAESQTITCDLYAKSPGTAISALRLAIAKRGGRANEYDVTAFLDSTC